jgi:hypothetical protein
LQNVENAARAFATRVDKETCDRRRKGGRLDFDATTRETWFRKSLRDAELREAAAAKERAKTGLFDATSF